MIKRLLWVCFWLLILALLPGGSSLPPGDLTEKVRYFTRANEFDFASWTLDALALKIGQSALRTERYLPESDGPQIVLDYIELLRQIQKQQAALQQIYADPNLSDPLAASVDLRAQLAELNDRRSLVEPLAEAILQAQVSQIVADLGLTAAGQPIPPVLYRTSPPLYGLVVSPRDRILQTEFVTISPDLSVDQHAALEEQVDQALDVSSLVVGIGGMGLYPTLFIESTSLNWVAEVVGHEWIHNYLGLRPLGLSYMKNAELRTMNETTAAIAGKEIGAALIRRYYPQLAPAPAPAAPPAAAAAPAPTPAPPSFDYRAEMRQTRVTADELLAAGKLEEAEAYMEQRRRLFWENGYLIRKLNQAFFAFHGAYADQPGGAAGSDPVGEAVRSLRANSPNLARFINRLSWMWSFEQLQQAVQTTP